MSDPVFDEDAQIRAMLLSMLTHRQDEPAQEHDPFAAQRGEAVIKALDYPDFWNRSVFDAPHSANQVYRVPSEPYEHGTRDQAADYWEQFQALLEKNWEQLAAEQEEERRIDEEDRRPVTSAPLPPPILPPGPSADAYWRYR